MNSVEKRKLYSKEYRKKNKEKLKNYSINWCAKNKKRYKGESNLLNILIWQEENPEKVKAHQIVSRALKNGELIKPKNCDSCSREVPLSGHHPDYSKPLEVLWLCGSCHKLAHPKNPNKIKPTGYYARMKESIENSPS